MARWCRNSAVQIEAALPGGPSLDAELVTARSSSRSFSFVPLAFDDCGVTSALVAAPASVPASALSRSTISLTAPARSCMSGRRSAPVGQVRELPGGRALPWIGGPGSQRCGQGVHVGGPGQIVAERRLRPSPQPVDTATTAVYRQHGNFPCQVPDDASHRHRVSSTQANAAGGDRAISLTAHGPRGRGTGSCRHELMLCRRQRPLRPWPARCRRRPPGRVAPRHPIIARTRRSSAPRVDVRLAAEAGADRHDQDPRPSQDVVAVSTAVAERHRGDAPRSRIDARVRVQVPARLGVHDQHRSPPDVAGSSASGLDHHQVRPKERRSAVDTPPSRRVRR